MMSRRERYVGKRNQVGRFEAVEGEGVKRCSRKGDCNSSGERRGEKQVQ